MSQPTFQSSWNPKRGEVTYRIGKAGTKAFLLFGASDIAQLHNQLTEALKGTYHDRSAT